MANVMYVFLLLVCLLLTEGRISVPELKGIEPLPLEIPLGGLPLSLIRNKRQQFSNVSHIGVTTRLHHDNHNVAVVHWSGFPSRNIFILTKRVSGGLYGPTSESFLWRSTDYGATFVNETAKFPSDAVAHWYYISKDNVQIIFKDLVNNRFYVTTDEGENYSVYNLGFSPSIVRFSYSAGSDAHYVLSQDTDAEKLFVSTDLGHSWFHIGSEVGTASWTYLKEDQTVDDLDDPSAIYFTTRNHSTGRYRVMKARFPYQINNTDDVMEFDTNLGDVLHFEASYEYLFAVKDVLQGSPLFVSYKRRPFVQARFPLGLEERHYSVVDASEGQVFIAVYHNSNYTNLYLSEEEGLYYSLTLEDVITNGEANWNVGSEVFDVHVVEGIKGTYIANIDTEGGAYGATVISFDKGAEWVPVTAPTLDFSGQPLNCFPPDCSLHLHIDSSSVYGFSTILSKESAVGLIMAQGNIGKFLRVGASQTRLYFSHNGGFSWQELFRYSYTFQFLDAGSIVAAVRKYTPTSVVEFSCDEGVTWNTYNMFGATSNASQILVVGMLTEIGEKAVHATAFGLEQYPFKEWLLVDLDFSVLNIPQCNASNYTTWVPTDERLGQRCLLGERVVYEKRISGQCCINGPQYERPINTTLCECAIEDFECDFNFERIDIDSPCVPVRDYDPYAVPTQCHEGTFYNVSSGYRRIAGDKCIISQEENDYFLPQQRRCPIAAPEALYIVQDTTHFGANKSVLFELFQLAGGKLLTLYKWEWGDNTSNLVMTSYNVSRSQKHVFAIPGVYTIVVTATNDGGFASVSKTVTVLDYISEVAVNGPQVGVVYTKISYAAQIVSLFQTNYTGDIVYSWNFNDGSETVAGSAVSHTFSSPNNYMITCTASNSVGSKTTSIYVLIEDIIHDAQLVVDPPVATANQLVGFSVTMKESDYYGTILYSFIYGDGSVTNPGTLDTASHNYTVPGYYMATVSLENLAGVITVSNAVYIQDVILRVIIKSLAPNIPLLAIVNGGLVFTAVVTSSAGTNYYYPVTYHWDFGDGNIAIADNPSVSFSYTKSGTWNITLTASNNVSSATFTGQVHASKAVSHVNINGPSIVSVGTNVTFYIYVLNVDEVLPSSTMYTWSITHHTSGAIPVTTTGTNLARYSTVFSTTGTYEVVVLGQYTTGSFTASFTIIVRSVIGRIDVDYYPVVEINKQEMLSVHLFDTQGSSYGESVNLMIAAKNQSDVLHFESAPPKISYHLLYQITDDYTVLITASNEVSTMNKSISFKVVSTNASVILLFNTTRLKFANADYKSSLWTDQFVTIVDQQITTDLHLPAWQLVGTVDSSIADDEYFRIQLDVLPRMMQEVEYKKATDIGNRLIELVLSEDYHFMSPEHVTLTVTDAMLQKAIVIVEPIYHTKEKSNSKLAVELGVGGGIALLVAITLCIVGIAYYRRKFRHLEVQYSRLRQSDPVHFKVGDEDDNSCGEPSTSSPSPDVGMTSVDVDNNTVACDEL